MRAFQAIQPAWTMAQQARLPRSTVRGQERRPGGNGQQERLMALPLGFSLTSGRHGLLAIAEYKKGAAKYAQKLEKRSVRSTYAWGGTSSRPWNGRIRLQAALGVPVEVRSVDIDLGIILGERQCLVVLELLANFFIVQ